MSLAIKSSESPFILVATWVRICFRFSSFTHIHIVIQMGYCMFVQMGTPLIRLLEIHRPQIPLDFESNFDPKISSLKVEILWGICNFINAVFVFQVRTSPLSLQPSSVAAQHRGSALYPPNNDLNFFKGPFQVWRNTKGRRRRGLEDARPTSEAERFLKSKCFKRSGLWIQDKWCWWEMATNWSTSVLLTWLFSFFSIMLKNIDAQRSHRYQSFFSMDWGSALSPCLLVFWMVLLKIVEYFRHDATRDLILLNQQRLSDVEAKWAH